MSGDNALHGAMIDDADQDVAARREVLAVGAFFLDGHEGKLPPQTCAGLSDREIVGARKAMRVCDGELSIEQSFHTV